MTDATATTSLGSIHDFVSRLSLAPRQAHKALTLWPLLRSDEAADSLGYVPLADALARGEIVIEELARGASVPHVQVTNRGKVAVLVLFGEELLGARQNRIANASFLVPAYGSVVLDVSCVEHGRWSERASGRRFDASGGFMSSAIKRKMQMAVSASLKRGAGFHADQGEVWEEVAERVSYSRTHSPSGAYADYVATRRHDLDDMAAAFHPVADQVGFVALIGEEVAGMEAIGRGEVFSALFPGLLRSYLVDAVDQALVKKQEGERPAEARFADPESFLAEVAAAPVTASESLGAGTDLRLETQRLRGCALAEGDVVHLTAYPALGEPGRGRRSSDDELSSAFDPVGAEEIEGLARRIEAMRERAGRGRGEKKAG